MNMNNNNNNMLGQSNEDEFDGPEITEAMHQEQMQEALRKFWLEQITEMQLLDIGKEKQFFFFFLFY